MPHDHQKSGFSKVYKIQKMIFPKIRRFLLDYVWIHFLTFSPTGQDRSKVGHNLVPFNTFFSCEISHGSFASQDSIEVGKKLQGPPLFTF